MKNLFILLATALVLFVAPASVAMAKGLGGPIRGVLMFRDVAVVIRAHVQPGGDSSLIVDQNYYGPYQTGDRLPVIPAAFQGEILVPGGASQPEMFLVLSHFNDNYEVNKGWPELFAKDLKIETSLSRRLADGRVYAWGGSTKLASYAYWRYFTSTAPLTRDETHGDLAALEADAAEGISLHDDWAQAKATTDPATKLTLLRPFLLPGGKHQFTAYEVWSCTSEALEEVEKAGPTAAPFLQQLLTEPSFQENYAPQAWLGYGAQERAAVLKSLALVEARATSNPQDKLARLRPVFDVPHYEFRAGFDPVGMVQQYFDRALAVAISVDAAHSHPFLQELLGTPQFQVGYSPIGTTSWGRQWREKIQAALAAN